MPSRSEVSYFGAGPAPLPTEVLESASSALLNYKNLGIGITEMSHRSPEANAILADAKQAMIHLLDIPESYEILFLQGGGSGEFSAVVYHMVSIWVERARQLLDAKRGEDMTEEEKIAELKQHVNEHMRLDYLVTGSWSLKASQEAARLVGADKVHVVTDARKHNNGNFGMIPSPQTWDLNAKNTTQTHTQQQTPALTYFCDNETVDGVELATFPAELSADDANDRLVVADMSSNFLSRRIDIKKYAIIFGGAQKNVGIPGVTIVIIRKSLLSPHAPSASPDLLRALNLPIGPIVLDFSTMAKNDSLYNTLPIFDVWIAAQVMQRLVRIHGDKKIGGQEEVANEKARLIYRMLDQYEDVYSVVPDKAARSRMNICLRIRGGDADAEKRFIAGAEKLGLLGLKGHRSVGGIRVSNCKLFVLFFAFCLCVLFCFVRWLMRWVDNAVPVEAVQKLVKYVGDFAKQCDIRRSEDVNA